MLASKTRGVETIRLGTVGGLEAGWEVAAQIDIASRDKQLSLVDGFLDLQAGYP